MRTEREPVQSRSTTVTSGLPPAEATRSRQQDAKGAPARAAEPATSAPDAAAPGAEDITARQSIVRSVSRAQLLAAVWLLGVLAVLGRLVVGTVAVSRLASGGERVADGEWLSLTQRLAGALGIRRPLTLLRGERLAVPVTWGVVYPVVLLPDDAASWPDERRRYVLVHEMAHVQRLDALTQLVSQIALAIFWFNPLMWLAVRRIRLEREHACDDIVLQHGTPPSRYASDLLEMVREIGNPDRRQAQPAFAALAMARRSEFEGRMLSILDPRQDRGPLHRGGASMSALVMLCVILPLAALTPIAETRAVPDRPLHASPASMAAPAIEASPAVPKAGPPIAAFGTAPASSAGAAVPTIEKDPCTRSFVSRGSSTSIHSHTDDDGSTLLQYSISTATRCLQATFIGRPVFSADARDLVALSPDGRATIHEVRGDSDRRLTIAPDATGGLVRTYMENGVMQSAGSASEWLAGILPEIVRETGIDAKGRTERIRKAGGVTAVLSEISLIHSTGAKRTYFDALLDDGHLTPEESERVTRQVAKELAGSSGDLRAVLAHLPTGNRVSPATRSALGDAVAGMQSSGDKASVLTQYGLSGDREMLLLALEGARTIESDGDLSSLLATLAANTFNANDAALRTAFFAAERAIESDGDARRVLEAAAPFGHQNPAITASVLEAARHIDSDGDKSAVLVMVAGQRLLTTAALRSAYMTTARTIASDGDFRRAVEAAGLATTIEQ